MAKLTQILRQYELGKASNFDEDHRRVIAEGVRIYLETEHAITTYEIKRSVKDTLWEQDFPISAIPTSYWRENAYLRDSGDIRWTSVRTAALEIVSTRYPKETKIVIVERPDERGLILSLVLYQDERKRNKYISARLSQPKRKNGEIRYTFTLAKQNRTK